MNSALSLDDWEILFYFTDKYRRLVFGIENEHNRDDFFFSSSSLNLNSLYELIGEKKFDAIFKIGVGLEKEVKLIGEKKNWAQLSIFLLRLEKKK